MVTVQHGASEVLAPVGSRLEAMPDLLRHGPSAVLYGICDAVVDDYERIETFDALLTDILTANLAQISIQQNEETRQQNEDMRRISAWVALVAADTVVTGIYGMNFDNMPELHTRYGYFVCIAFMLVLDTLLYRLFRRSGWL
jgi:magnesium transporter